MVFNSFEEIEAYVRQAMIDCATATAQEMINIMKQQIEQAYGGYSPSMYVRTMALLNTPEINIASESEIETEFKDNGGWYSLRGSSAGAHFFALEGLEGGYTWGRGETNIYDSSVERCKTEAVQYYFDCMKAHGIPLQ